MTITSLRSGLKAVALAAQAVQLGESEIVVAAAWSPCPTAVLAATSSHGYRIGDGKLVDSMINDACGTRTKIFHMGMTGNWSPKNTASRAKSRTNSRSKATRRLSAPAIVFF